MAKKNKNINVGVIGVGHLGRHHTKHYAQLKGANLIGVYDIDKRAREETAQKYNTKPFDSMEALIKEVDAVSIVTPTHQHKVVAESCIKSGKHVFIEKPITKTLKEANALINLADKNKRLIQVGHIERLNPALIPLSNLEIEPKYIEVQRLAPYMSRGTDVPVVLDLMIHDIDAILSVVKSDVKKVHASGVYVISETPDIANARIEFENGCVANLTASRISMKKMRKARFFQKDAYISVDFLEKKCEVVKMKDAPKNPDDFAMVLTNAEGVKKQIYFDNPQVAPNNAILDELDSFADAITQDKTPEVSLTQGAEALRVAMMIIENFKTL